MREEHRLRVFENRVLRRIFGPKRDGVTGEWRKLHNEELNDLYSPVVYLKCTLVSFFLHVFFLYGALGHQMCKIGIHQ